MSILNFAKELSSKFVTSAVPSVDITEIDPNRQYFVVVDGLDALYDLESRRAFQLLEMPNHFLEQCVESFGFTRNKEGEIIDVTPPGLGRHLYRMSGADAVDVVVNMVYLADAVLGEDDSTESRRITRDDIIEGFHGGYEIALRVLGANVTVYDVTSLFRAITLDK